MDLSSLIGEELRRACSGWPRLYAFLDRRASLRRAAPVHEKPEDHAWFVCYRQSGVNADDPQVQVADCPCGARAKIYPGPGGLPEIRIESPNPGGSVYNSLIRDGQSALGDPHGSALRLMN